MPVIPNLVQKMVSSPGTSNENSGDMQRAVQRHSAALQDTTGVLSSTSSSSCDHALLSAEHRALEYTEYGGKNKTPYPYTGASSGDEPTLSNSHPVSSISDSADEGGRQHIDDCSDFSLAFDEVRGCEDQTTELCTSAEHSPDTDDSEHDESDVDIVDDSCYDGGTFKGMLKIPGPNVIPASILTVSNPLEDWTNEIHEKTKIKPRRVEMDASIKYEYLQQHMHDAEPVGRGNGSLCRSTDILDGVVKFHDDQGKKDWSNRDANPAKIKYGEQRETRELKPLESTLAVKSLSDSGPPLSASYMNLPRVESLISTPQTNQFIPGLVQSPASCPSSVTQTLEYYKSHEKNKENIHPKSRRNASLPEEIAELNREAEAQAEEIEDLERYRAMDLTPMEPVMESDNAGDLITLSTPPCRQSISVLSVWRNTGRLAETDQYQLAFRSAYSAESGISGPYLPQSPVEEDGIVDTIVVPDGNDPPSSLVDEQMVAVDRSEADVVGNEVQVATDYPTFTKIIIMVPGALFWVLAAPVTNVAIAVYDRLVEKLTGLDLDGTTDR